MHAEEVYLPSNQGIANENSQVLFFLSKWQELKVNMSSVKQALSEAADIYHLIGIEYNSSSCYLLTLREYMHCLSISLIGVCPREVSRLLQSPLWTLTLVVLLKGRKF